jgi:hypothetical protein
MLLDHGALRSAGFTRSWCCCVPPPRPSLPTSAAAAALPTPSIGPFAMETTEKMLTRQVSAAVRLQAAAHGLLARWRMGRLLDL